MDQITEAPVSPRVRIDLLRATDSLAHLRALHARPGGEEELRNTRTSFKWAHDKRRMEALAARYVEGSLGPGERRAYEAFLADLRESRPALRHWGLREPEWPQGHPAV